MSIIYGILSAIYISLIFSLAWLPGQLEALKRFNFFNLLHIPLYGLLAFFLIRTFWPINKKPFVPSFQLALVLVSLIALLVAILDELNQIRMPGRDCSFLDILLDGIGISLTVILWIMIFKRQRD